MFLIKPGTWPSYDWVGDLVLAPLLLADDFPDGLWKVLFHQGSIVKTLCSGIIRQSGQTNVNRAMVAAIMAKFGVGNTVRDGTATANQEHEEEN